MATFVLNSSVLTTPGVYVYSGPLSKKDARALLAPGFTSAVRHASAASLLSEALGVRMPVADIKVVMNAGDVALVFRANDRLPEGVVLDLAAMKRVGFELMKLERIE